MGATWHDYYGAGFGRHRDSDCLERANFRAALTALGFDEDGSPPVDCPTITEDGDDVPTRIIVRENHWAVGWVEWIAIHETDTEGLTIADELRERVEDYPVLDDELYSEFEGAECSEVWSNCYNKRERLEYLREHLYESCIPGCFRSVRQAIKGEWSSAAELLPCPSDLLC